MNDSLHQTRQIIGVVCIGNLCCFTFFCQSSRNRTREQKGKGLDGEESEEDQRSNHYSKCDAQCAVPSAVPSAVPVMYHWLVPTQWLSFINC